MYLGITGEDIKKGLICRIGESGMIMIHNEKPKERKMLREFKDGDRVVAQVDVYQPDCRQLIAKRGEVCVFDRKEGGRPFVNNWFVATDEYDLTGFFRKVDQPRKMTVQEISTALGHDVEVVKG